jgi:uncharacterized protein
MTTTKTKRKPPPAAPECEFRTHRARFEIREGGATVTVAGYASTTNSPYSMGAYTETVRRGAFAKTLANNPDVPLLINHEGLPLARTTAGNLELTEDTRGLHFRAQLDASDPDVKRIVPKLRAGLLTECSFAFKVNDQRWSDDYENRELLDVDINRGDVSLVSMGANPNTSAELVARSARLAHQAAMSGGRGSPNLDTFRARAWALALRGRR